MTENKSVTVEDIERAPENLPAAPDPDSERKLKIALQNVDRLSDERNELKLQVTELKRAKQTADILDRLIEPYATKTFWFMVGYCGFVGAMLLASSMGGTDVHISDDVMKILVGSTAITVIGLVGMILTGVFVGARKS